MNAEELFRNIQRKKSFLCVGLDTDYKKIPRMLLETEYPIFEFNKRIVDATAIWQWLINPTLHFMKAWEQPGI